VLRTKLVAALLLILAASAPTGAAAIAPTPVQSGTDVGADDVGHVDPGRQFDPVRTRPSGTVVDESNGSSREQAGPTSRASSGNASAGNGEVRLPRSPDEGSDTADGGVDAAGDGEDYAVRPILAYRQIRPVGHAQLDVHGGARANTSSVDVAIVDTGVDDHHPDLDVSWAVGVTSDGLSEERHLRRDRRGHGTHVAGVIGARNDSQGIVGVAPNADLYSLNIFTGGNATTKKLRIALRSAKRGPDGVPGTADDAEIVSTSLRVNRSPVLDRTLSRIADDGTILIASAGNAGDGNGSTDEVTYPATHEDVLAVGATTYGRRTADFSSEGDAVDVVAPGTDVLSLGRYDGEPPNYVRKSGTSMAAPYVAGLLARLVARNASVSTTAEARALLAASADDVGRPGVDNATGYGIPDYEATVSDVDVDDEPAVVARSVDATVLRATRVYVADDTSGTTTTISIDDRLVRQVTGDPSSGQRTIVYASNVTPGITAFDVRVTDREGNSVHRTVEHAFGPSKRTPFAVPVVGSAVPSDVDGDGRFEDLDGDGNVTFVDTVTLLFRVDEANTRTQELALDFDGDGRFGFLDVVAHLRGELE
jgi:subtilisin family serine protease